MADPSAQGSVQARLEAIHTELAQIHPQLYRDLALYLQVLRDGLLATVRQVCFHLVTQVNPHRYGALPAEQRRWLQHRLETLVRRCCSLLTVEQLAHLAGELSRREHEQRRVQRQLQLQELAERERKAGSGETSQGSVDLGLDLPIGAHLVDAQRLAPWLAGLETPSDRSPRDEAELSRDEGEAPVAEPLATAEPHPLDAGLATGSSRDGARPGLLPTDPLLLLRWLSGFDQALTRRLRNLSHGINVELLRLDISAALLPLNLLDAVLQGHVEAQPAPANLLRLSLPLPPGREPDAGTLETHAVLLRSGDLELELPALRTCRRRLQQAQQQVRRMARESARLQRRLATLEAQRLWLQDINTRSRPQA